MELGAWLQQHGVTQEDLAERLGVDQSTISRLIHRPGKRQVREPSLELAVLIEKETGGAVKPSDFVNARVNAAADGF